MAADPFAHARPNWEHISSAPGLDSDRVPLASTAPVLKIYEEAVQEPGVECRNIDSLYSQAQLDGSDRYDARILREDFCSTAIIATTWAGMDARNRSQGVDIDLVALKDTHARLRNRPALCSCSIARFRPGWTIYQSAICRSLACDWRRGRRRSKRRRKRPHRQPTRGRQEQQPKDSIESATKSSQSKPRRMLPSRRRA